MCEEEEGWQHKDKEAAGKPCVIAESLEERKDSSKVSTGKIDEQFVPKNVIVFKGLREHLLSLRSIVKDDGEI